MGCDIHAILQFKNDKCEWETFPTLFGWNEHRDYALFNWLAGVRGGYFPGPKPMCYTGRKDNPHVRGLPKDLELVYNPKEEIMTQDFHIMPDGSFKWMGEHSYSYLYLDEIFDAINNQLTMEELEQFKYFIHALMKCSNEEIEQGNIRLVFGFDS